MSLWNSMKLLPLIAITCPYHPSIAFLSYHLALAASCHNMNILWLMGIFEGVCKIVHPLLRGILIIRIMMTVLLFENITLTERLIQPLRLCLRCKHILLFLFLKRSWSVRIEKVVSFASFFERVFRSLCVILRQRLQ